MSAVVRHGVGALGGSGLHRENRPGALLSGPRPGAAADGIASA